MQLKVKTWWFQVKATLSEFKKSYFLNNYLLDDIQPQIADCRKLEVLQLRNNKLCEEVPWELYSLIHIRILDLSFNMFSDDLGFLNCLRNLKKLSCDNNMFAEKAQVT